MKRDEVWRCADFRPWLRFADTIAYLHSGAGAGGRTQLAVVQTQAGHRSRRHDPAPRSEGHVAGVKHERIASLSI